jgi:hypothetical protein
VHELEEAISHNDEEIEDPFEASLVFVLPTHEDKEMVIFSHTDGFMKEPLDLVVGHIDMFIQTGKRIWDIGCVIFYGDPMYNIERGSHAKSIELSPSKDWCSCAYDSYLW